ncbi:prepilin-type N-terminal cleavage/methylation domain-containing protein [Hyphomonas sp. BRH_c22]|uniref:prepilin-type N-terminal cleavage/methylation domain-containing protein n=1 Tax=Hyphomonas sp. BRH_c22 TaxID=1629710 RepID=UPI000A9021B3|nr:prepilin-type N-terminal cleavage/methylation domain-containing protein [Hyphomonas sp. BRH_c22]
MTHTSDPFHTTEAGMTLTEVLVAVFIMALAAGMVTMTLRPRADPLVEAATRLEQDVSAALNLALVTGIPQGLMVTDNGYQRVRWTNKTWSAAPGGAVSFGRNVGFDARLTSSFISSDTDAPQPDVILDSTGTAQSEPLKLVRGREAIELNIAPNGEVKWEAPDA